MKRRDALLALLALWTSPPTSLAQQPGKIYRIGWLSGFSRPDVLRLADEVREELRKLGWTDGQNVVLLEPRTAEGLSERLAALANEVVDLKPDVIVVQSAPATRVLKQRTDTIPIVMLGVGDPVEYGLIVSFSKPGGNVTGTSFLVNDVGGKLLELLKEAAPAVSSVALFHNPTNEGSGPYIEASRAAAKALRLRVQVLEVKVPADFDAAFAKIRREQTGAIAIGAEPLARSQRARIADFAINNRLPLAVLGGPRILDAGLLAYGPKVEDFPLQTAAYIDKILRGAKPAELPVERPRKFELTINQKSAKAIGLAIPQSLLARADEVIR